MPDTATKTPGTRRSRETPDKYRRIIPGDRDAIIVRFLLRFSAATSGQIRQLFDLSVNGGNRVLRRLFDSGLVRRHTPTLTGSVAWHTQPVYTVGPQAADWAAQWENVPLDEARRRCRGDRTPTYLAHALSIVDLYLALKAAVARRDEWTLHRFLVERECADILLVGMGKKERQITVRPDAVAVVRHRSDGSLFCLALESDRHNVRAGAFAHKVESYKLYVQNGAFAEAYPDAQSFRVLVVTGSETRIATLAGVVREAGAELLFLFTTRPDIEQHGFLTAPWRAADGSLSSSPLTYFPSEGENQ